MLLNKFEVISVSGKKFKVIPHVFWSEFRKGDWEPQTYDNFERNISEQTTFVDLGAWLGVCSIWASAIGCKKIYTIEANPESYALLKKTFNANEDLKGLIDLFNYCVTNQNNGIVKFGRKTSSASRISQEGHYEVETITLRTFFEKNEITEDVFLKMDIEGAEELALEDLLFFEKGIANFKVYLALHPPFWKNKKATCARLMEVCKEFKVSLPSGERLEVSQLEEMVMSDEEFPAWSPSGGNFFEIMLSNNNDHE